VVGAFYDEVEATMLFVALLKWQTGMTKEQRDGVLMRRSKWDYPAGINLIGEYWPQAENAAVVSIFETDDLKAIMELRITWGYAFEIDVVPAVTIEDGLRMGGEILSASTA